MSKLINLFLIDDDPTEKIKCTLQNWTGVVYKIPRNQIKISKMIVGVLGHKVFEAPVEKNIQKTIKL